MPQPEEVEALAAELLRLYAASWQKITVAEQHLINTWAGLRRQERLTRLRELRLMVERLMDDADSQALRFVQEQLPQAYVLGAAAAGVSLTTWAQPDIDAIGVLARDTYSGLLDATTFVRGSTKTLIRYLAREHVADKLIRGATAEQAGRDLARDLEGRGIAAVVYKDGSRHSLDDYASMLTRTKAAEAYSVSTLTQIQAAGIGWVEVFDGIDCIASTTRVVPYGELRQLVRASFEGPLLTITAGTPTNPRSVTVGPNHPMLTARGWVRAHLIEEGDQLVYDRRFDAAEAVPDLDLEHVPPVADLFEALVPSVGSTRRLATRNDLHGDAAFCDGEIEVVAPAGRLLLERDAALVQQHREPMLVRADVGSALIAPPGHEFPLGDRVLTSSSNVGLLGPSSPLRGPCPPVPSGQRLATRQAPPVPLDGRVDDLRGKVQASGDLSGGQLLVHIESADLLDGGASAAGVRAGVGAVPTAGVVVGMEGGSAGLTDRGSPLGSPVTLSHDLSFLPVLSSVLQDAVTVVYDATTTTGIFNADGFVVKNCGWEGHDDVDKANGTIRAIDEAMRVPLSHPRCRRAFGARPDVTSAAQARDARPSTTPAQQADQAEAEARRALDVSARASRRSFERSVQRRTDALLSDETNRVRSPAHASTLARREALKARQARLARRSV